MDPLSASMNKEDYMGTNQAPISDIITLADILTSTEVVKKQEDIHKKLLNSVLNLQVASVKEKLVQWALMAFPSAFSIYEIEIVPPSVCSDGVARDLTSYIQYLTGKTLSECVSLLQPKFVDITVTYACFGNVIKIVVIKP